MKKNTNIIIFILTALIVIGAVTYYNYIHEPKDVSTAMHTLEETAKYVGTSSSALPCRGDCVEEKIQLKRREQMQSSSSPQQLNTTTITEENNNQTVHVKLGSHILVKLGEINWNLSISDPGIINRVKNVMMIRGAQGIYTADKMGVTTLSAEGRPFCTEGQICAQYIVNIHVVIVVE